MCSVFRIMLQISSDLLCREKMCIPLKKYCYQVVSVNDISRVTSTGTSRVLPPTQIRCLDVGIFGFWVFINDGFGGTVLFLSSFLLILLSLNFFPVIIFHSQFYLLNLAFSIIENNFRERIKGSNEWIKKRNRCGGPWWRSRTKWWKRWEKWRIKRNGKRGRRTWSFVCLYLFSFQICHIIQDGTVSETEFDFLVFLFVAIESVFLY